MKNLLLDKLLNKYERSKHAKGEAQIQRRVSLWLKKDFPQYEGYDFEFRKSLHNAANELKQQGLIEIEWVPFEEGNLIKSIHLRIDKVDKAYLATGRKPKLDTLGELETLLTGLSLTAPWSRQFINDCLLELHTKLKYPAQLPADPHKLKLLLDTLVGLETKGAEEMLERIFSKRYLGHSKDFERHVRRRLVGILRRYYGGINLEEEALLAEVGLVRAASEVLLHGPLTLELKGKALDLAPFYYGVSLGSETLHEAKIIGANCTRVISIENKASFREIIRKGTDDTTLLLCLGGFAGPVKRTFLGKLYRFLGDAVEYYHWGDIDYGGLQIFIHLRICLPGLQPLWMDIDTYESYLKFGEKYDIGYEKKLQSLLEHDQFSCFHQVIQSMLKHHRTLEQEAINLSGMPVS